MRIREILAEYDRSMTLPTTEQKLVARIANDISALDAMEYAKKFGTNIKPSNLQSTEGINLWDSNAVHLVDRHSVTEGVPQPGESSGAPKQFGADAKIQTRQMTVKDIILSVPGVPYYNNVVNDWDAKDYSWGVTKKVIEYATYLKDYPESLAKLPPAIVLNGKFEDGAHRVSAIWLLQQRMDPTNPLWGNAKLNVQFVEEDVAEGSKNNNIYDTDQDKRFLY